MHVQHEMKTILARAVTCQVLNNIDCRPNSKRQLDNAWKPLNATFPTIIMAL